MLALETDGAASLRFVDVVAPVVKTGQVLVRVTAASLNRGDAVDVRSAAAGERPGWDFAGIVERAGDAAMSAGTRVCGFAGGGAWAQKIAVDGSRVGVIPDNVSDEVATTLPVAGVTADRLLQLARPLAGKTVVVTGAAGGVGHLAVQLVTLEGGTAIAISRTEDVLGALRVAGAIDEIEAPVDVVLESLGGPSLERALEIIDQSGTVVSFGASTGQPAQLKPFWFGGHHAAQLVAFNLFNEVVAHPPGAVLTRLLRLSADRALCPNITQVIDWSEAGRAVGELVDGARGGKTVLTVG